MVKDPRPRECSNAVLTGLPGSLAYGANFFYHRSMFTRDPMDPAWGNTMRFSDLALGGGWHPPGTQKSHPARPRHLYHKSTFSRPGGMSTRTGRASKQHKSETIPSPSLPLNRQQALAAEFRLSYTASSGERRIRKSLIAISARK